jgi:WWE domain
LQEAVKKAEKGNGDSAKPIEVWECLLDSGWTPYEAHISTKLSKSNELGQSASFTVQGKEYKIDFSNKSLTPVFEQVNVESGYRRKVRLREKNGPSLQIFYEWRCYVDGAWVAYPSNISQMLEAEYQNKGKTSFALNGNKYEVDFSSMQQTNTATKYKRQVSREQTMCPSKFQSETEVDFPLTWTCTTTNQDCKLVKVPTDWAEWKMVETELRRTLPSASLYQVQRVQNISLWKYFQFQANRLSLKSDSGTANIHLVWHGTRSTDPRVICTDIHDGFMMQRS